MQPHCAQDCLPIKTLIKGSHVARAASFYAGPYAWTLTSICAVDVQDPDHRGDLVRTLSNVVRGRMQAMPQHVSLGCTSLVARALVRDAGSRITLRQMADDVWLPRGGDAGAQQRRGADILHFRMHNPATLAAAGYQRRCAHCL